MANVDNVSRMDINYLQIFPSVPFTASGGGWQLKAPHSDSSLQSMHCQ